MVDRREALRHISSRDHCQRSSLSRISDTPLAGFEPAQNMNSGLVEWSCAVVITITSRCHTYLKKYSITWLGGRYVPNINDLVFLRITSIEILYIIRKFGFNYLFTENIIPNIDDYSSTKRILSNLKDIDNLTIINLELEKLKSINRIWILFPIITFSWSITCPITKLLKVLNFNLLRIEGVSHGSSKLPKLHVSSSKLALSRYTRLGVEFILKKWFEQAIKLFGKIFFQLLRDEISLQMVTPISLLLIKITPVITTK